MEAIRVVDECDLVARLERTVAVIRALRKLGLSHLAHMEAFDAKIFATEWQVRNAEAKRLVNGELELERRRAHLQAVYEEVDEYTREYGSKLLYVYVAAMHACMTESQDASRSAYLIPMFLRPDKVAKATKAAVQLPQSEPAVPQQEPSPTRSADCSFWKWFRNPLSEPLISGG